MRYSQLIVQYIVLLSLIAYLTACNSKTDTVQIMSFNIRNSNADDGNNSWSFRREACVKMVCDKQPDIIGLQEALPVQLRFLIKNLPEYEYVGVGRDPEAHDNEACAILYSKKRFRLLRTHTFWLSPTPDSCSLGWDAKYKRVATYVVLHDKHTNKEMVCLNTHLDHKGEESRRQSLQLIADSLRVLEKTDMPLFAMGDMNQEITDSAFVSILTYMKSAQAEAPVSDIRPSFTGFSKPAENGKTIDFIFYRNIQPLKYEVVTNTYGANCLSDHCPILAIFE